MRILVLATAPGGKAMAARIRERAELAADVQLELVTVTPGPPLPGFAAEFSVEPSLLPGRRLVPTAVDGVWPGPATLGVRGLRVLRRALARAPIPARFRVPEQRFLEVACRTSTDLHERARAADAVIVLDPAACLGAWELARRVPETPVVFRPKSLRKVLAGLDLPAPPRPDPGQPSVAAARASSEPPSLHNPDAGVRLLIGPANYAGQGHAWARAAEQNLPDTAAMNFRVGLLKNPFPADYVVDGQVFATDLDWRVAWFDHVRSTFTHAIVEANLGIFGAFAGKGETSVSELRRAGRQVALLSHGSDARIPSVHAANERWHSYDNLEKSAVERLERIAVANVRYYREFDGPVFVSTPGILEFVPNGTWLPVVVEPARWTSEQQPMQRSVPVVTHIPSTKQKGSHMIDPVLQGLADRGVIEYLRVQDVPHAEMPALYGSADIMVEQFGIADYSVAACEAMAAGRVVVSRVADKVREHVRTSTGLELPVVEANPETLEQVILDLIADRERAAALAAAGPEFVRAVHDGRRSAQVLDSWLRPQS